MKSTLFDQLKSADVLPSDLSKQDFQKLDSTFPVVISKYILDLIIRTKDSALIKQFVPDISELDCGNGVGAFFNDDKSLDNYLIQKYPNRCIIYATSNCFANCRYCTRKEKWNDRKSFKKTEFDKSISTLRSSPHIEEVIITGGDPLTLSLSNLEYILSSLKKIKSIKVIRLATRAFTSNPSIINDALVDVLRKNTPTVICTQFNCESELSEECVVSLERVQLLGIPVLNQSVLLAGVNDTYEKMKALLTKLVENRVIPYHLFHAFKTRGTEHLRTSVETGEIIVNQLVGNVGGWWRPKYIIVPHETGVKIPLCPNGLVNRSENSITVKDFHGRQVKYE